MDRVTWLDVPGIREGARIEGRMGEEVLDRWSRWEDLYSTAVAMEGDQGSW